MYLTLTLSLVLSSTWAPGRKCGKDHVVHVRYDSLHCDSDIAHYSIMPSPNQGVVVVTFYQRCQETALAPLPLTDSDFAFTDTKLLGFNLEHLGLRP